ncbi:LysR family transcriptional regulator [Vibrio inusitatus NBRC 102082]|uniref:LysR family transcriptional regulator n=1 Tax=Vibrio inusitatus NBRC 102082 TaxID=1219070 RepID=A0A4Y3HT57_9VIBR|nr:LysR family transcriptional regulator [Vibrio inusitatus]GEA49494.1 LysR family transcriptional regulator [Vibrio inusitatus NBRC 102082]
MKTHLDDLYLFCLIVEHGSVKKTHEVTGLPISTISRRLAQLEENLCLNLMIRGNHTLKPTSVGQSYFESLQPVFEQLMFQKTSLEEENELVFGSISLAVPSSLYSSYFHIPINEFLRKHSNVNMSIQLEFLKDLTIPSGVDIAILVGDILDKDIVARKISEIKMVLVSTPNYISSQRPLTSPEQLKQWDYIAAVPHTSFYVDSKSYSVKPKIMLSNMNSVLPTVLDHIGFSYMPLHIVRKYLERNELEILFPNSIHRTIPISLVYHNRKLPLAQKKLVDYIVSSFKKEGMSFKSD